jgi:two-component system response regulator DesR
VIRILLLEDMTLLRGALAELLAYEDDLEVVAQLDRAENLIPTARRVQPDVAVIDIGLPGVNGINAARALREALPACQTMILTGMGTPRALRQALEAKVRGFVLKNASPTQLAYSIRQVAKGECVIDSELAVSALSGNDGPLTARECEVLEVAAEGTSVPEIARRLSLATGTVRNYLSASISKLGASNRVDAVRIARDAGWI